LQPLARGVAKLLGETIEPGRSGALPARLHPDTPPVYERAHRPQISARFIAMGYDLTEKTKPANASISGWKSLAH
jgi:hypothetical protein